MERSTVGTGHMTMQLARSNQTSPWEKVQAAYFFETLHSTYLSGCAAVKLGKYSLTFSTV